MNGPSGNALTRLVGELHRRSLWQVLAIYLAGSWVALEVVDFFVENFGLPGWFPAFALALLVLGLPVVLATAFVQEGGAGPTGEASGRRLFDASGREIQGQRAAEGGDRAHRAGAGARRAPRSGDKVSGSGSLRRFLTWRNALLGAGAAAALWGVVAAVYLVGGGLLGETDSPVNQTGERAAAESWADDARRSVTAAAEVIAVTPFTTSGPGVETLGEGLVDLLSTNLDQVGAIRTRDPRTVLKRWEERFGDGRAELEEVLELGRELEVGSVLVGSVVAAGSEVRIDGRLLGVDGDGLARASVSGPAADVLTLVDELSVGLLRDVWRSGGGVPTLRVSAVTTSSLDAVRAYLEGERLFRRALFPEAREAFLRAVEDDPGFALAHLRLAWSYAWLEGPYEEAVRRHARIALENADRLPGSERELLRSFELFVSSRLEEAVAPTRAYLERHPDDPEAWFVFGNLQFHHPTRMGLDPEELYEPFDRVIALDSSLAMAYIHPLQLALAEGDSARFYAYLAGARRAGAADPRFRAFEERGEERWGKGRP